MYLAAVFVVHSVARTNSNSLERSIPLVASIDVRPHRIEPIPFLFETLINWISHGFRKSRISWDFLFVHKNTLKALHAFKGPNEKSWTTIRQQQQLIIIIIIHSWNCFFYVNIMLHWGVTKRINEMDLKVIKKKYSLRKLEKHGMNSWTRTSHELIHVRTDNEILNSSQNEKEKGQTTTWWLK